MADRRISELPAIPAVAGDDALAIVDTSLSETNKVSVEDLLRSAPAGTAAAPSIAFVDDPDTGLYRSAANELSISTAGSQRVVIDSNGNVGIGTSSPGRELHVVGASNVIRAESTGTAARIEFENLNSSASDSVSLGSVTDDMQFVAGSTERMRITSAGNVGIGTSSPGATLELGTVTPVLRLNGSSDGANVYGDIARDGGEFKFLSRQGASTPGSYGLYNYDGTTESIALKIDNSGNVGIGTSSPGDKLHVFSGNARLQGSTPVLTFQPTADTQEGRVNFTNTADDFRGRVSYAYGDDSMRFLTNTSERLRIDNSGRLLVGTTSGRANFDNGTSSALIQAEGINSYTSGIAAISNRDTANINFPAYLRLARSGASTVGSNALVSNNCALGRIDFSGADGTHFINAANITAEVDGTPGVDDMPGRLLFMTTSDGASSPTERMRITSAGNVGIGTSSPARKLHVVSSSGAEGIQCEQTGALSSDQARVQIKTPNSDFIWYSLGNSNDLRLFDQNANAERMRIDSAGNVGIGTGAPGEKLEVNGTIKATDINFTGLATYADDSAAGTGGLVAGDVYKTSTGELRIKL